MPDNFYRHFETDCVKLCGEIKHGCAHNGLVIQTVTPFDKKNAHRGKAWLRTQSLRKCIQTKKGASQTTVNHKPNKAISWNEQLGKPSEKVVAMWWQNTKASRHWKVSTFWQTSTQADNAIEGPTKYKLLLTAFKDEDRQRGPRKHRGALWWGIPMLFLGKTRALGWGIPIQFWASLRSW